MHSASPCCGGCIPPVHADVERFACDIFQQYAGDDAGLPWRRAAGAAGDLAGSWENDGAIAVAAMMIARDKLNVEFAGREKINTLVESAPRFRLDVPNGEHFHANGSVKFCSRRRPAPIFVGPAPWLRRSLLGLPLAGYGHV